MGVPRSLLFLPVADVLTLATLIAFVQHPNNEIVRGRLRLRQRGLPRSADGRSYRWNGKTKTSFASTAMRSSAGHGLSRAELCVAQFSHDLIVRVLNEAISGCEGQDIPQLEEIRS